VRAHHRGSSAPREARTDPSDDEPPGVRGAGREQQPALERPEGDGQVGDDRAVRDRPVVGGHTGRQVAGDDGRSARAGRADRCGRLDERAAQRTAGSGPEQAVDDDVGVGTAGPIDEVRSGRAGADRAAGGQPARARAGSSSGGGGIDAVGRDDADLCAPGGQQRRGGPAVPAVVAATDHDVDAQARGVARRSDDARAR
jgi:hypothetical protein